MLNRQEPYPRDARLRVNDNCRFGDCPLLTANPVSSLMVRFRMAIAAYRSCGFDYRLSGSPVLVARHSHLDGMFLPVINKGNSPIGLLDPINGGIPFIFTRASLHYLYMIDGLAVSVVNHERFPISRETGFYIQLVHFEP